MKKSDLKTTIPSLKNTNNSVISTNDDITKINVFYGRCSTLKQKNSTCLVFALGCFRLYFGLLSWHHEKKKLGKKKRFGARKLEVSEKKNKKRLFKSQELEKKTSRSQP